MSLQLSVSQQPNDRPYRFPTTGIQVYTFEEVLYHVYHYWKRSVDDITAPDLAAWVNDTLGLSFLAAKLNNIARIESFSERMLAFLRIIEYFDDGELAAIRPHLEGWEKRLEWEAYKERADDLAARDEPGKAIALYHRALQYDENISILNNLSVAYMQTGAYDEACRYLERARELNKNKKHRELNLHYCEALILAKRFEEAAQVIKLMEEAAPKSARINNLPLDSSQADTLHADTSQTDTLHADTSEADTLQADILYLRGELSFGLKQYSDAVSYFEQAISISLREQREQQEQYVFRLADVYAAQRQFEKAIEILAHHIPDKDHNLTCLMKEAEMHNQADYLPGAIRAIKKALELRPGYVELWVRLARYYRLDYNLPKAEEAITKALSLDAHNERARLESARIKKNMGQTKTYQQLLKGILTEFKERYRELSP